MKIGILTQPFHTNYGGILQNYALQQVLIKGGIKVETINWGPKISIYRKIYRVVKYFMALFFPRRYKIPRYVPTAEEIAIIQRNTNRFINKYINHTSLITDRSFFFKLAHDDIYEGYIVGSDQCWRPRYNPFLTSMFLDFTCGKNVKRISYAASFGTDQWEFSTRQTIICSSLLKKFDFISVREDSGIKLCVDKLGVQAVQVLDPTMLLEKEYYIHLIEEEKIPKSEGSLFNYILDPTEIKESFINSVAEKLNLKSFRVLPKYQTENRTKKDVKEHIEDCVFPGVTTWLRAFFDAEMTIVDSFHGMVFSIIFNKPFWVIGNSKRGMTRFSSLLKLFNLEDRLLEENDLENIDFCSSIDWECVNAILKNKREESKKLLLNSLQ